ncbi:MAG TPA: lactate permease LctP family transporter [Bryobacterales bacterium]|nr:lactate permease LctP family transporter [Bryobacterales bacterium]
MWEQNYYPVAGSLWWSTLVASVPLLVLFYMLGVKRKPSWMAALWALAGAWVVALAVIRMPVRQALAATIYGAAFGLFPIGWIVFSAILLYRITVDTGKFEIIKDSVGRLSDDRRLQALLIAFSFGAFIEGAAGFGTPVAVAAAMLAGLGFSPFYAAAICLLANTAPVAFGSIGIPIITLSGITGLPKDLLSAMVGRICALISLIIPTYLVVIMAGAGGAAEVWPAVVACGGTFALVQFSVSNFIGPELTDILASLASIGAMVLVMKLWHPKNIFRLEGDTPVSREPRRHSAGQIFHAWSPYVLLVIFVLLWGYKPIKTVLEHNITQLIPVPALHNLVVRMPPVTKAPQPYAAVFTFNWLSAAGTSCFFAAAVAALALGMSPKKFASLFISTNRQLALPMLTIASVLGLAFLMNYAGMTYTLGLAFAATGAAFPFFSSILGWLGVFLTGSDTASNALFGNLQVVTANAIGIKPVLTAAVNSAGGVMGKMISLQSIAVAVAATEMATSEEGKLFRFTLRHSIILATVVGLIALGYAYLVPSLVPSLAPR